MIKMNFYSQKQKNVAFSSELIHVSPPKLTGLCLIRISHNLGAKLSGHRAENRLTVVI